MSQYYKRRLLLNLNLVYGEVWTIVYDIIINHAHTIVIVTQYRIVAELDRLRKEGAGGRKIRGVSGDRS